MFLDNMFDVRRSKKLDPIALKQLQCFCGSLRKDGERMGSFRHCYRGARQVVAACLVWLCVICLIEVTRGADDVVPFNYEQLLKSVSDKTMNFDMNNFKIKPSVVSWDTTAKPGSFAITSMVVEHHAYGSWYLPHLHDKYSAGWNRTVEKGFMQSPSGCNLRFIAVGKEETLDGFEEGGTGWIGIEFENEKGKKFWHGYDKNETNKVHCYYSTNKDRGSEFLDKPKHLDIAIYCPLTLDDETGYWDLKGILHPGLFCRPLSEVTAQVEITLRPSNFIIDGPDEKTLLGTARTNPASPRATHAAELVALEARINAVCTVQTFRNPQTGPMLYLFIAFYQLMGWRVIVYDRFGQHRQFVKDLLSLPGVEYHPYTIYQMVQPEKYNQEFYAQQGSSFKAFYKMEINWGHASKKLADTADQDADKSKTYDYAKLEYSYLNSILYVDSDEIFYCPQASQSKTSQRAYQQKLMLEFYNRGIEEMRFVRLPFSGLAYEGYDPENATMSRDFTMNTFECMSKGFNESSLYNMLRCWSEATSFDGFSKSADFAGVCPFHYNHWSCDGGRGGGRDFTKNRCRCKVGFDMMNQLQYKPMLNKCHLMHLNDNKYRFESNRGKGRDDKGSVLVPCPVSKLFATN